MDFKRYSSMFKASYQEIDLKKTFCRKRFQQGAIWNRLRPQSSILA